MAVAAVQNVRRDFVDVAKHFRRDAIFADVNEILAFFFLRSYPFRYTQSVSVSVSVPVSVYSSTVVEPLVVESLEPPARAWEKKRADRRNPSADALDARGPRVIAGRARDLGGRSQSADGQR